MDFDNSITNSILDSTIANNYEYGIEIAGGFGPLAGKIWRIGLMGESSKESNVLTFLAALEDLLAKTDHKFEVGSSLTSAKQVFAK